MAVHLYRHDVNTESHSIIIPSDRAYVFSDYPSVFVGVVRLLHFPGARGRLHRPIAYDGRRLQPGGSCQILDKEKQATRTKVAVWFCKFSPAPLVLFESSDRWTLPRVKCNTSHRPQAIIPEQVAGFSNVRVSSSVASLLTVVSILFSINQR